MNVVIQPNVRRYHSVRQLEDLSLWKTVQSCNSHLKSAVVHVLHVAMVLPLFQHGHLQDQAGSAMMRSRCSNAISDMRLHLVMVLGRKQEKKNEKTILMLMASAADSRRLVSSMMDRSSVGTR